MSTINKKTPRPRARLRNHPILVILALATAMTRVVMAGMFQGNQCEVSSSSDWGIEGGTCLVMQNRITNYVSYSL